MQDYQRLRRSARTLLAVWPIAICLGGCDTSHTTDQQIKEQAERTTVAVKQETKQAVVDTQKAAAVAERKVDDVAAGVKEGIDTKSPGASSSSSERVDINHASLMRLAMLPGISLAKANEIVNGRPYTKSSQLVSKGVLTKEQYEMVVTKVAAD